MSFIIDPETIKLRCPINVYQKGQLLFNSNKVGRLNFDGNHVSALVFDGKEYNVDIEIVDNKVVNHKCTCKESIQTIGLCKHVVAVLLTFNRAATQGERTVFAGFKVIN